MKKLLLISAILLYNISFVVSEDMRFGENKEPLVNNAQNDVLTNWNTCKCYVSIGISKISSNDSSLSKIIKPQNRNLLQRKIIFESKYYGKQLLAGEVAGLGGGLFCSLIAGPLYPKDLGIGGISWVAVAMYTGYTLGNSVGIYFYGNEYYDGSYFKTLIGSILGASMGYLIFKQSDQNLYAAIICPPLGAILGYNLYKKPKNQTSNAIITFDNGSLGYSLKGIVYSNDYLNRKLTVQFNIVQVNF